jgi:hypothetical protein
MEDLRRIAVRSAVLCVLWVIAGLVVSIADEVPVWWSGVTLLLASPSVIYVLKSLRARTGRRA